ncbi:MAG: hypothetical protein GX334_04760 [Firmicutes bacterium]|nr:hypothetical protein [Bacillota bacterium]
MYISLLFLTSVDLFICGVSYGIAGKKVPLTGVLLMSALSSIMFSIAFMISDTFLSEANVFFAKGLGKALFIILGIWVFSNAASKSLKSKKTDCTLLEFLMLGSATSVDAFIAGATLSFFGGSLHWALYVFISSFSFFTAGRLICPLVNSPQKIRIASALQGLFFCFWGIFI